MAAYDEEGNFVAAREKALHFLGRRARTEKETREKLARDGFSSSISEAVIQFLKEYHYVDDEEYAREYTRERAEYKGLGRRRIGRELWERGVCQEIIDAALNEYEWDELSSALSHVEKKTRGEKPSSVNEQRRCVDYLLRRGFSFETARQALKLYMENDD